MKTKIFIWCGITITWILLIWGHSLMPFLFFPIEIVEFFILGFLLSVSIRKCFAKWPIPIDFCVLLIGTLIALCDESIQAFVPDRSCQLTDVVIDFTGVFCAVLIVMLVKYASLIFRKQK